MFNGFSNLCEFTKEKVNTEAIYKIRESTPETVAIGQRRPIPALCRAGVYFRKIEKDCSLKARTGAFRGIKNRHIQRRNKLTHSGEQQTGVAVA